MMIFVVNFIILSWDSPIEEPSLKETAINSDSVDSDLIKATNDAKIEIKAFSGRLSAEEITELAVNYRHYPI